jgi:primosomal protein DnaI
MYLFGGVGSGKSRLAASVLNEYWRTRRTGVFFRVPKLLHDLSPAVPDETRDWTLSHVTTTKLVVLDDVGAERDVATDYTRRTLLMIYEDRGDRGLRTIWTSNKHLDDLATMLEDDRLTSRIAGRSDVVYVKTSDQRMARRRR